MISRILAALALLSFSGLLIDSVSGQDEQKPLQLSATLVQTPAVVTDQRGQFVSDLSKSDFVISEDGKRQAVETFAAVKQPFNAVLVIDTSNSAADRLKAIQDHAVLFLRQIRPEDRAMVVSFDNEVKQLTDFTSDRAEMEAAIRGAESGFGKLLYEAVALALDKLRDVEGRRAIILFSDVVDMRSIEASAESVIRLADEIGAVIYVVQFQTRWWIEAAARKQKAEEKKNLPFFVDGRIPLPPDLGGPDANPPGFPRSRAPKIEVSGGPQIILGEGAGGGRTDPITETLDQLYGEADKFAEGISRSTGGQVFRVENVTDIRSAFAAIAEELRNQYLLGYYARSDRRDGKYHKIKVEVVKKGLVVRARTGYRNPGP
jgi:VWFA-related protein